MRSGNQIQEQKLEFDDQVSTRAEISASTREFFPRLLSKIRGNFIITDAENKFTKEHSNSIKNRLVFIGSMKGTFTDAGWDFIGEDFNGDSDSWRLCVDGSGYPRLAWEYSRHGDFVCGDGVDMADFGYFSARYLSDGCGGIFDIRRGINHSSSGRVGLDLFAKISECWMRPLVDVCELAEISGDAIINGDDLQILAEQWQCSAPVNWDRADINGDGIVNESDFAIFSGYWLDGSQ